MESDDFRVGYDDDLGELAIVGDLGDHAIEELRNALDRHSGGFTRSLVVNLGGVTYLPSVALGVLASGLRLAREAGGRLELVAGPGTIAHRVLTVTAIPHRSTRDDPA